MPFKQMVWDDNKLRYIPIGEGRLFSEDEEAWNSFMRNQESENNRDKDMYKKVSDNAHRLLNNTTTEYYTSEIPVYYLMNVMEDMGYTTSISYHDSGKYVSVWFKHEVLEDCSATLKADTGYRRGFSLFKRNRVYPVPQIDIYG